MNSMIPRFGFGANLWDDFGREFDEMFQTLLAGPREMAPRPSVESWREDGKLHVRVDLPGVDPKDVEVALDGTDLTIRGERKVEREEKDVHREVRYGHFERRFTVPRGVEAEKVEARYENGVLALTIPLPEAPRAKRIPVATAPALENQKAA